MSVVLRPTTMKVRNEGEEFHGFNVVADQKIEEVLASIPRTYTALSNLVSDLKNAIDILNAGGLIMKDDVIAENVSEWLDEHPDATVTVQDGSITAKKLVQDLQAFFLKARIAFLYQNPELCDTPSYKFGASTIIHNDDVCIIYDFGADTAKRVLSYLQENNITAVDVVIGSHYHSDHMSYNAVSSFVSGCETNNIDLSGCTFYLPHANINWSSYIGGTFESVDTNIVSLLTTKNISYVKPTDEGYTITAGGIKIEFYNLLSEYFDDYYNWTLNEDNNDLESSNYNNFSMCAMVTIGARKIFLTGDIMLPAEENMAELAKQADCITVPHHGLNCRESKKFIDNLSCQIGVVQNYWTNASVVVEESLRPITNRCKEIGVALSTLESDVIIDVANSKLVIADAYTTPVKGSYSGQKLIAGENLNTIDYGTFYVDGASEAEYIVNWPAYANKTLGASRIECVSSGSYGRGKLQTAYETYSQEMKIASRKYENGEWSHWKPCDTNAPSVFSAPTVALDRVTINEGGYEWVNFKCNVIMKVTMKTVMEAHSWYNVCVDLPYGRFERQPLTISCFRKSVSASISNQGELALSIDDTALEVGDVLYINGTYQTLGAG